MSALAVPPIKQVLSKKEYMDTLGEWMVSGEQEEYDEEQEHRGRRRQLKSYLIEVNSKMPSEFRVGKVEGTLTDGGIEGVKILNLHTSEARYANFYVDTNDPRFWILHTSAVADSSHDLVDSLFKTYDYMLDRAWIPSQILDEIRHLERNTFHGFGLNFEDYFAPKSIEAPIEESQISVSGTNAESLMKMFGSSEELKGSTAYARLQLIRGSGSDYVRDDLYFNGRFMVREGRSIDDHMSLVESARALYRKKMDSIESNWIGAEKKGEHYVVKGKALNLVFKREISDFDFFLSKLLDQNEPFRLWGLKGDAVNGQYRVLAVDLHTGDPIDLEISSNLMRVYLPEGTCGNSLLRLYTNLQQYFDSDVVCEELSLGV